MELLDDMLRLVGGVALHPMGWSEHSVRRLIASGECGAYGGVPSVENKRCVGVSRWCTGRSVAFCMTIAPENILEGDCHFILISSFKSKAVWDDLKGHNTPAMRIRDAPETAK